jgi:excisionase family DNA binding protein|tara:strand:- start:1419 stop:1874 length:456 start_codon:yes stop_codon:yes gene_type:complete
MSMLTLGQASKLVGKSKPTISKAVKDGKLTGERVGGKDVIGKDGKPERDKDGRLTGKKIGYTFQIEKSELERVYGKTSVKAEGAKIGTKASGGSAVADLEKKHLEEKVADLKERLEKAEEREREANTRLDAVLLQIEDKRPKSLMQRLFGK